MAEQSGKSGTKSGGDEEKISKQTILNGIVDAMIGDATLLPMDDFGAVFHLVEPEAGKKLILEELAEGVVIYVDEQRVVNHILRFCHEILVKKYGLPEAFYKIFNRDAEKIFELWRSRKNPLPEMPSIVGEHGDSGLTFRRLPFSIKSAVVDEARLSPAHPDAYWFAEFGARCTNSVPLFAYIGSFFFPESDRQQYVYMWGEGQNGKGTLIKLINWTFESACMMEWVERSHGGSGRFWLASMVGKRVVCFPECNTPQFLGSATCKTLTGDDAVPIEEKNKPVYKAKLTCKLMFFSNENPQVTGQKSDLRRIIPCEVSAIPGEANPRYFEKMKSEAAVFFKHCIEKYRDLCPDHGPVPCEIDQEELTEGADSDFSLLVRDKLDKMPTDMLLDKQADGFWITAEDLLLVMKEYGLLDKRDQNKFRGYLKRTHGVVRKTIRDHRGVSMKVYFGIRRLVKPFEVRAQH